jgi:hypothetical protein
MEPVRNTKDEKKAAQLLPEWFSQRKKIVPLFVERQTEREARYEYEGRSNHSIEQIEIVKTFRRTQRGQNRAVADVSFHHDQGDEAPKHVDKKKTLRLLRWNLRRSCHDERLEGFQHFRGVCSGGNFGVDVPDFPFRIDHVCNPPGRGGGWIIARSVLHADVPGGIAKQWEREPVFFGEGGVCFDRIETDTQNLRVFLLELLDEVTEPGPFGCSPGGVCLRIKPQNNGLSAKIRQVEIPSLMVLDAEIGRRLSCFQ